MTLLSKRPAVKLALIGCIGLLIGFLVSRVLMRPVLQIEDSPGSSYTARLFRLYNEGGTAPYGEEVTLSSAGNPLGRFIGDTLWIGYCSGGRISWKSTSELELNCPPHPDAKDVFVSSVQHSVAFRVVRQ
jgi:hypothetical protein